MYFTAIKQLNTSQHCKISKEKDHRIREITKSDCIVWGVMELAHLSAAVQEMRKKKNNKIPNLLLSLFSPLILNLLL